MLILIARNVSGIDREIIKRNDLSFGYEEVVCLWNEKAIRFISLELQ